MLDMILQRPIFYVLTAMILVSGVIERDVTSHVLPQATLRAQNYVDIEHAIPGIFLDMIFTCKRS